MSFGTPRCPRSYARCAASAIAAFLSPALVRLAAKTSSVVCVENGSKVCSYGSGVWIASYLFSAYVSRMLNGSSARTAYSLSLMASIRSSNATCFANSRLLFMELSYALTALVMDSSAAFIRASASFARKNVDSFSTDVTAFVAAFVAAYTSRATAASLFMWMNFCIDIAAESLAESRCALMTESAILPACSTSVGDTMRCFSMRSNSSSAPATVLIPFLRIFSRRSRSLS